MAVNRPRRYLICYDIANPYRLVRVHRYLVKRALHVQYSVFLAHTSSQEMQKLMVGLADIINPSEDDVRSYALPATLTVETLGRQSGLQEGFLLLIDGEDMSGVKSAA
jgi:CRISPR-associated protein Cas2